MQTKTYTKALPFISGVIRIIWKKKTIIKLTDTMYVYYRIPSLSEKTSLD